MPLNEQVKRNRHRFPPDFMYQLTKEETRSLTSQFARSNQGRGDFRTSRERVVTTMAREVYS
ncbi:MAG: ORF6N domain-containing protein [Terriglobia bacterium]